jgi:hypothetical protein
MMQGIFQPPTFQPHGTKTLLLTVLIIINIAACQALDLTDDGKVRPSPGRATPGNEAKSRDGAVPLAYCGRHNGKPTLSEQLEFQASQRTSAFL